MKLRQQLIGVAVMAALAVAALGVGNAQAQVWAHYNCQIANVFFNPITNDILLPVTSFVNFTGTYDPDDGVDRGIATGFTFDYNGQLCNSVDVGVNGFIMVNTVGNLQQIPTITNDNNYLFNEHAPNDALAPFWGDHFYRTIEPGYVTSKIHYSVTVLPDPNPLAPPGSVLRVFTVEWTNLNVINKLNPTSVATFQVKLIQNPNANSIATPDERVTIEFDYGNVSTANVSTSGAAVGIKDSTGDSFENGLFPSNVNSDSTRLSTTNFTSQWPPSGLPGRVIQFVPKGTLLENQWGDGDVTLQQLYNPNPVVRANQNLFVTLNDADTILESRTLPADGSGIYYGILDSVEGGPAFHGDANHSGRYQNPNFPSFNLYFVTAYDAAYILLYLAAKLPILPWPNPLPVPAYNETVTNGSNVSGVSLDMSKSVMTGNTLRVPVVLRGSVNGPLSLEAYVNTGDNTALQFVGTQVVQGSLSLIHSNAKKGIVALATTGVFNDGDVMGYLEFNIAAHRDVNLSLEHVAVNDQPLPGPQVNVPLSTMSAPTATAANGFNVEQNAPNPFNPTATASTAINFTMGVQQNATVRVYDLLGHVVRTLLDNATLTSGAHTVNWDGRDNASQIVPNGMYYYQITTPSFTQTVKMEVVR